MPFPAARPNPVLPWESPVTVSPDQLPETKHRSPIEIPCYAEQSGMPTLINQAQQPWNINHTVIEQRLIGQLSPSCSRVRLQRQMLGLWRAMMLTPYLMRRNKFQTLPR